MRFNISPRLLRCTAGRFVLCGALLSACDGVMPNGLCTAPRSIAIEVDVSDSLSGRGLADSTTGAVQAGSYTDSLQHVSTSATLLLGGNQLGTYTVTVSHAGYVTWVQNGVRVTQRGTCGNVIPVHLAARLSAAP